MIKASQRWIIIFLFFITGICHAQDTASYIRSQDSLSPGAGMTSSLKMETALHEKTGMSTATYFKLLGGNFKQAVTKPFHMKKADWKYFSAAAMLTGTLSFEDETVQRFALDLRNKNPGLCSTSSFITNFGANYELYTLSALGAYSFLFKKRKMQTTFLLSSQAFITSSVLVSGLKFLTVRTRPSFYKPPSQAEPYFLGPFVTKTEYAGARTNTSFPSGHTASVFAVATVFASEYKDRPWIPILAYSAATLVGLSRITENKHWTTDVVAGAALGYVIGRQTVNNYHNHSAVAMQRKQKKLRFNLQYSHGHIMPGLVFKM